MLPSRMGRSPCRSQLCLPVVARALTVPSQVLRADPENLKALYRRAQAHMGLKRWDAAAKDCSRVLELDAGNAAAKKALLAAQAAKQAAKSAERRKSASTNSKR